MTTNRNKIDYGWGIARAVTKLAYIYESELKSDQNSEDIEEVLKQIETLLLNNKSKWEEAQSQISEHQAVESLTKIIEGISSGEIFKDFTEEEVQIKIWNLLIHGENSNSNDYHEALKVPLPTKEEISEFNQGPKEFARYFWGDFEGHKKRSALISYGRKIKSEKIKFRPFRSMQTLFERKQFIVSTCVHLLQLKTDEVKWMGEGFKNILSDSSK